MVQGINDLPGNFCFLCPEVGWNGEGHVHSNPHVVHVVMYYKTLQEAQAKCRFTPESRGQIVSIPEESFWMSLKLL